MKLYYSRGACSLAVRIIINELEIPCEFVSVDIKSKKTETGEDFLNINTKGCVPTLEIEKNKILTENVVIQQYLADTHQPTALLPPLSDFKRYRVLEWLTYISTELHKNFGPLFNQSFDNSMKNDIFIPILKKKFLYVESQLNHKKFLTGDHFTLPDAYLFVLLNWTRTIHQQVDIKECSQLQRYFNELKSRKSIQLSLKQEQLKV